MLVGGVPDGELLRVVRVDEGQDDAQCSGLEHAGLNLLVGHEDGNGQAGVVAHAVVVHEGEGEEPLWGLEKQEVGWFTLGRGWLIIIV